MTTDANRARAVVIGGSMAGLLAARVLAESHAEVTVIDRDRLPTSPEHRRGVPQAHHAHALLARGQQTLEELFPGLTAALAARGAPTGDMLADARLHFSGYRLRQAKSGVMLVSASRILLEDEVRRRVRALSGVTFAPPSQVVGLTTDRGGERITGVRLLRRTDGSAAEVREADLVVDASGRGSRAPEWLEALGHARPEEDRVCMDLYYTSLRYRLAPDALGGDLACVQAATPANPRTGALARLEGNQWLLTLAGILGDRPPADADGFLAFARSLSFPDIYEAIRDGEPFGEPATFRFRESVRRHYERLTLPDGFLPFGDSLCSFNPIYGQGMAVAALQALALKRHMQAAGAPPTRRILGDFARVVDAPWEMARGADLALPAVPGHRSWSQRLLGSYIARLHAAAAHDARLGIAFVRVCGMLDAPGALLRPSVALRALWRSRVVRPHDAASIPDASMDSHGARDAPSHGRQ
jgi:2-polyprenyl-6-methoxyphenol hydroxylase-like FAD-dependent oxidoreductase